MKPVVLVVRAMEYGSHVDFMTDSGIYRYWIDREAALYIRKMGKYCPGKMMAFAKGSCTRVEKLKKPEVNRYIPLRLKFVRKFEWPSQAIQYVMDSFMLGVEKLVVRGTCVYEIDRIPNK